MHPTEAQLLEWLKFWGVRQAAITFDSDKGALLEVRGNRNSLGLFGDDPGDDFALLISNEHIREAGL